MRGLSGIRNNVFSMTAPAPMRHKGCRIEFKTGFNLEQTEPQFRQAVIKNHAGVVVGQVQLDWSQSWLQVWNGARAYRQTGTWGLLINRRTG